MMLHIHLINFDPNFPHADTYFKVGCKKDNSNGKVAIMIC